MCADLQHLATELTQPTTTVPALNSDSQSSNKLRKALVYTRHSSDVRDRHFLPNLMRAYRNWAA